MKCSTILFLSCIAYASIGSNLAVAQHATAFDVIDGGQAFQNYCANCHGPDGDLIAGVDLGHGNFRQAYSDADLANIIMNGIADTPMPPTPGMNEEQALKVVAYLRDLGITEADAINADASFGRELFEGRGECQQCHRVNGQGSRLGPDLSKVGLVRTASELEASLLDPTSEVQANNRFYTVVLKNGQRYTGRLLNHDTFTVQMLDADEDLRSFIKTDLQEFGFTDSQMPSLNGEFSTQEINDLIAYLVSLRGIAGGISVP